MQFPLFFITALLFTSTFLASCSSKNKTPNATHYQKLSLDNVKKQSFVTQEDIDTLFLQTRFVDDAEKTPLLLAIGRNLTQDSQYALAKIILEKTEHLSESDYKEKYTLLATSYLNLRLYPQAYNCLKILSKTDASHQIYFKLLLAWYYYEQGSFSSYLIALDDAHNHSKGMPQLQKIILNTTWKSLQLASRSQIQQIQAHPNQSIQSWNDLRSITDPTSNPNVIKSPEDTLSQLYTWQDTHSEHPGSALFKTSRDHPTALKNTDKVGLMLPLSGKHKKASELIQKGIYSALFETRPPNQVILAYDSSQSDISALYKQAVIDDHIQSIIGPLTKNEVQQLLVDTVISVPTITLNQTPHQQKLLTQYSLNSNQEISQLVSNMILSGYKHPLVLSDSSELAKMIARDFTSQIEDHGGIVSQSETLLSDNFNQSISNTLGTSHSQLRHQFIQSISTEPVRMVARKRQDIDSVFVAGDTKNIRQIIPLLKYHYSGNLPIFSTSSINSSSSTKKNKDMSNALFFDTPGYLSTHKMALHGEFQRSLMQKIQASNPSKFHEYFRFYGLGLDAYLILQTSYLWETLEGYLIFGANGLLSSDEDGKIHRELSRMTFDNGTVLSDKRFDTIREHWKALTHHLFGLSRMDVGP